MPWYDYGIQGRNGNNNLYKSGGLASTSVTNWYEISDYIGVGSVSLHESMTSGERHETLLTTTPSGTQIYVVVENTVTPGVAYNPYEEVMYNSYASGIKLRKDGRELEFPLNHNAGYTLRGSIYECMNRVFGGSDGTLFADNGRFTGNILQAMPRSKSEGGATQQICMITSASGIDFYIVGYPFITYSSGVEFHTPAVQTIGHIPASALNNVAWFDPGQDGISENDYSQFKGGASGIGDRPVDYNYTGTDVDFPGLPTGASALGFGAMDIFHPTASQLKTALDIIWSMVDLSSLTDLFDTIRDVIVKIIYKPEQYCVSLMLMPLNISGTSKKIYFGKYDTGASAPAIDNQWQIVDCGSLSVPLKSGSAFDFSPYVKTMIYLPYVGFRSINANEIMGGTIYIKYYVDMFTGSALCMVKIKNENSNTSVLYTYECNVAQQVPITASIYGNLIGTLISASVAVVSGNPGAMAGAVGSGINNLSPDVQISGQLNANTGALGNEKPYVVLHFPVQSMPSGFVDQNGYPSNVNITLNNLSGYTEVEKIHLNIPGASKDDLDEIQRLLNDGVIL